MADEERPGKSRKVEQNHQVVVTHINRVTMDHYCKVIISPDHMNPGGLTKPGIKLGVNEFSKGCKTLADRCNYRLLTPLSTFSYQNYLNKATEDFMKNGMNDGPVLPVVQVSNQSPFRFKSRSFVAVNSSKGEKVFELFGSGHAEFAEAIGKDEMPFSLNWSGPPVKDMEVNDKDCQEALVNIIKALEVLQPNIKGLGVCVLAEFGRFLIYNILVDGGEHMEDSDDEGDGEEDFHGYKQMLLVLQSKQVETGKSLLSEILLRIFHGRKTGLLSTVSFDSAKWLLGKGSPVVIDDFNNDEIGRVLLSRASKAIWGKSNIVIKNQTITPNANLLFCTNEDIPDLLVEGKNKTEIYMKLSVIDLGEKPMSSINIENKGDTFKELMNQTKVVRKFLPSFFGMMLQICGVYITQDEFKQYEDVSKHERLGNILKNTKNLYDKLNRFCEQESIEKPESLLNPLDTSCLTNKSELKLKYKTPDQIVDILMDKGIKIALTDHNEKQGIVFCFKSLTDYPWFAQSFSLEVDNVKVFSKMRTRQLSSKNESTVGAFVSFNSLKESVVDRIKESVKDDNNATSDDESDPSTSTIDSILVDPKVMVANFVEFEFSEHECQKQDRFKMADQYIVDMVNNRNAAQLAKFKCKVCKFVAKSKGGLTNHNKKCK